MSDEQRLRGRHLSTETHLDGGGWQERRPLGLPGLTVLWHPDPERVGERTVLPALTSGAAAQLSRLEPVFAAPGQSSSQPLDDPFLSRRPLRLVAEDGGNITLSATGTRTAVRVEGEPLQGERTLLVADLERGVTLLLADRILLLLHSLDPLSEPDLPRFGLVGESPAIVQLCREILQVADLDVPVLIRGETGTGKELIAGAIHSAGPRRRAPYLTVNLAAVPPNLAAAELFGAARGAFTGADRARRGYFQRAEGGSLFLDEIGEAPPDLQVQLLRALESGEIQPLGASAPVRCDVRIVSATDADLESALADGGFRAPLLHRLAGFEIELPPLRERREDFGRLLVHFLREELVRVGEPHRLAAPGPGERPWLPAPVVERLAQYSWPGNVRELRNVARQLVISSRGLDQVRLRPRIQRLLEGDVASAAPSVSPERPLQTEPPQRPDEISEAQLRAALKACRWRPYAAAQRLGISRASVYDLMAKLPGIRAAGDLGRGEIERAVAAAGGSVEAAAESLEVSALGLRRRMKQLRVKISD